MAFDTVRLEISGVVSKTKRNANHNRHSLLTEGTKIVDYLQPGNLLVDGSCLLGEGSVVE